MGENEHHQSRERSIDNDRENNWEEMLEATSDCCIYRVPRYLRKLNEEAYTPKLISIGPLHHGKKELMGMESQKRRYLSEFGKRVNAQKLEELKTYIKGQEKRIRAHYAVSSKLQSSEYVAMILCDSVFIIELFLRDSQRSDDFLLTPQLRVQIRNDLLLLENQLPYFVLNDLYTKAISTGGEYHRSFFHLSCKFFYELLTVTGHDSSFLTGQPQVKHFIDFARRAVLKEFQATVRYNENELDDLPCATKLNKSGLKFKKASERSLLDVSLDVRKQRKWLRWFEVIELQIPQIQIFDEMESLFRNLMALEAFHYPDETYICHYVDLMDHLIDTAKDVDLLFDKGIIVNCVGDNEAIAKMFNRLNSHLSFNGSCYNDILKRVKAHYKCPWNHAKATSTLINVYFSDIWKGTATVAATFLLIFTLIQTICSVIQVNQGYTQK